MTGKLDSKVAVVTGAGSGIGVAIAEALHREGAQVVVADVSGHQEDTAKRLGDGCVAVHADVSRGEDVRSMLETARSNFGRLDILCNNAGIEGELVPLGDSTEENYDRVMGTNARGVFLGMRYAIPIMVAAGGGSIINTASIAGSVAFPTMSAYCASKGAIVMLTKTAAVEYGSTGVRINAVCPGVTQTAMVDRLPEPLIEGAKALIPMGRNGGPEEMATAAAFLASDDASYITGTTITVDGGYTAM